MKALLVLYAGDLPVPGSGPGMTAEPLVDGKDPIILTLERSQLFPGVGKTVLLTGPEGNFPPIPHSPFPGLHIERKPEWTVKTMLEVIASHTAGFDLVYFVWADCPFLDPELAGKLAERHLRYAAEYSYADGWPYGLAPELLSPGTPAVLAKIADASPGSDDSLSKGDCHPMRDSIFSVIQKDINAFDIETEISPVDLRCYRLNLCADSKRNLLLLRRFIEASNGMIPDTAGVERIIAEKQEILRTLPAFYPIQVFGGCPQSCTFCPWRSASLKQTASGTPVTERRDYMESEKFESLLEKITAFSGDAVIDLSLWGEISLHPQKMQLIEAVLRHPELALVIETSGIGWTDSDFEQAIKFADKAATGRSINPVRKNGMSPLSWIVSLDSADPARYREIRGAGFAEARDCAKKLFTLFPHNTYVQAVRTVGAEDDIEKFYRFWKEAAPGTANIIIQKYDDFCGALPRRQASDLSPVKREPCWHLMRDMPVLIDGTVPLCREQIFFATETEDGKKGNADGVTLGNTFTEPLEVIWERGRQCYAGQCGKKYESLCAECDEYYTYNF